MPPQELKNSILQMAIQGRLVEQRPEEGTAEELYLQIQEEKQRRIKDGKIKKEKPLPEVSEDEKPFDIPESWKWVRLGDFTNYSQPKEKIRATDITPEIWSLDLEDIEKETGKILNICKASERKIVGDKVKFIKGQILYSKLRPYLKKILVAPDDGICSSEVVPFQAYGNIDCNYLVYVLKSPYIDYMINSATYGVKMPRVGTETMINLLIPLPSLDEQKRIVVKIEELLLCIDRYEQAWKRLEDFNKHFPDDMRKSILQMAAQGKLVEQRPEEGTAEELYQQIQAEKQQFIKSRKIKKEKPLPEISEDEKPFDIPESWKWVRLNNIAYMIGDIDHKMPPTVESAGFPYVSPLNFMDNGDIDYDGAKKISEEAFKRLSQKCIPSRNDIIFPRYGTIGVVRLVKTDRKFLASYSCCTIKNIPDLMHPKYVFHILQSKVIRDEINRYINKTTQPNVGLQSIKHFIFPLPPLAEQKRIVAKLEELLPLCEMLK